MGLDVAPKSSFLNSNNSFPMNTIFRGNFFLLSSVLSYAKHVFFFKFRLTIINAFACAKMPTTLFYTISNIVCIRSKKKMSGIYALRIIAFMKNMCSRCNIARKQLPRHPMGLLMRAFKIKSAITFLGVNSSNPYPARSSFYDFLKKAFFVCSFGPSKLESHNSAGRIFIHRADLSMLGGLV